MKIGFFGDSFCACPSREGFISWPHSTAAILNAEAAVFCKPGTHAYFGLQQLRKYIDEVDYAVFVISDPYRFPNEKGAPIMSSGFDKNVVKERYGEIVLQNMAPALDVYYRIFSREFQELGQRGVLEEVDKVFQKHNKPGFVIPAFPESLSNYQFKYVDWTDWVLKDEFRLIDRFLNFGYNYNKITKTGFFANHFSPHGNLLLSYVIADIIKDYTKPKYVNMSKKLPTSSSIARKTEEELEKEYQKKLEELRKRDPFTYKNF